MILKCHMKDLQLEYLLFTLLQYSVLLLIKGFFTHVNLQIMTWDRVFCFYGPCETRDLRAATFCIWFSLIWNV